MATNSHERKQKMTLKDLEIGKSAVIETVGGEGTLRQHFLDMGVIPGAEVTVVKYAPLGDPIELRIHGYELTLRLADAAKIQVNPKAKPAERMLEAGETLKETAVHPGLGEGGKYHAKADENPLPEGETAVHIGKAAGYIDDLPAAFIDHAGIAAGRNDKRQNIGCDHQNEDDQQRDQKRADTDAGIVVGCIVHRISPKKRVTCCEGKRPHSPKRQMRTFRWRSGWDSNPRGIAPKLISSQPRYDHFDISAY